MAEPAPLDAEEFDRWRSEADRAVASAKLQADGSLYNWSCFAAEQAAQLAIKALLHGLGRGPWGHDLVRLATMVSDTGTHMPDEILDAVRRLGRHYIPARYPDAHPAGTPASHYGKADAAEAVSDAQAVFRFVDAVWESLR